ncbi:MAG: hypothetical protein R2758_12370 [Bacteroidales bacterium]
MSKPKSHPEAEDLNNVMRPAVTSCTWTDLAQDPDLLILDFSMGLDPGYRRLFIDYMREYAKAEHKTVFVTSHIIQDMERLIDDVSK